MLMKRLNIFCWGLLLALFAALPLMAQDVASGDTSMREVLEAPPERLRNMGLAGRRAVLLLHDPAVEIEKLEGLMARAGSQP